MSVAAYVEMLLDAELAGEKELESVAVEGLNSGEPIRANASYWPEKHRRLDERLKTPGGECGYIPLPDGSLAPRYQFDAKARN